MICAENMPLEHILGYDVGNAFLHEHETNGVKVYSAKNINGL